MTTIIKILNKDFQEVFPSIIGDEEPKISVLDLMETSYDYIIKELQAFKEGVNEEKAELIAFLDLMEIAELDIEYDSNIHYKLKRLSERYPDYKSFRFFVYRYILNTSNDSEEYSLENFTHLIKRIIEDETLMLCTDFISAGFGDAIITLIEVSDELVSILEDAVSRYPQKITLLWITAHLYRVQENYKESIRYNKLFLEKLESIQNPNSKENFDLDFVDAESELMVSFQLADIHFDIRNYSEALYYCNKVLILDQDKENSSFYYDTLIIRIKLHMISNDRSAFQIDYSELIEVVSEEELKENYSDLIKYKSSSDK